MNTLATIRPGAHRPAVAWQRFVVVGRVSLGNKDEVEDPGARDARDVQFRDSCSARGCTTRVIPCTLTVSFNTVKTEYFLWSKMSLCSHRVSTRQIRGGSNNVYFL